MTVSRHYPAVSEGEVPVWIWNASADRWMIATAIGPRRATRRYNPAVRIKPAVRELIFERDGHRCQWPGGCRWPEEPLTIDHIVAVSRGGSKREDNLQVLCARHNADKNRLHDMCAS